MTAAFCQYIDDIYVSRFDSESEIITVQAGQTIDLHIE
jgi:hypothetical protein